MRFGLGQLMHDSHISLRDDFEVSSDALNTIVALAQAENDCFGARMTGAGFGGCAVALVSADAADTMAERIRLQYDANTAHEARVYVCHATAGTDLLRL